MPTAMREQVLAAFKAMLDGIAVAGLTVERNRRRAVQQFPSLIMVDGPQSASAEDGTGITAYNMRVDVEGYVQAASDADLGPALNALYAVLVAAANADTTLGGVAVDVIETDTDIDLDRHGEKPEAAFLTTFTVTYWTQAGDPYTAGP